MVTTKATNGRLEIQDQDEFTATTGKPHMEFDVRFDGCVHIRRWHNRVEGEKDDCDYMHICDLDEFIAHLDEVRAKAKEHFGAFPG